MELTKLLLSKNRALEHFLELTESFATRASNGDLDGLEAFQSERDSILKGLELYDRRIGMLAHDAQSGPITPESRQALIQEILPILEERDRILARISRRDEEIVRSIETERERISRELNQSRKAQSQMSKFKSAWVSDSGEELDQKL